MGPGGCFQVCNVVPPGGGGATPPPPQPTTPPPGGGGDPGPQPPTPPGGGGGPRPTAAPPPGLPADGYYTRNCVIAGADAIVSCPVQAGEPYPFAVVTWWHSGRVSYVVSARCAAPGECSAVTPTPRPQQTPPPAPEWPCNTPPEVSGGIITQPCPRWPGWNIQAQVIIPAAEVLRNPWPRSLVALPTKLTYTGKPNDIESFSDKALPCDVDYNASYTESTMPNCPQAGGTVSPGTRVNYQIGAAWRRWKLTTGEIFGFRPPDEVTWTIPDREWNGGTQTLSGYAVEYSFETTSWELDRNGPAWNPECQERDCACDERVQSWDRESYQVQIRTWWYPEWTFRYDEMKCTRMESSPCFCRPEGEPVGIPHSDCGGKPATCPATAWWGSVDQCAEYKWVNQTDPWTKYNLSLLGYQPVIPWFLAKQAGMTPEGQQCGSYGPTNGSIPVPVIEVQPVGVPN